MVVVEAWLSHCRRRRRRRRTDVRLLREPLASNGWKRELRVNTLRLRLLREKLRDNASD